MRPFPLLWIDPAGTAWVNDADSVLAVDERGLRAVAAARFEILPVDHRTGQVLVSRRGTDRVVLETVAGEPVAEYPAGQGRMPRLVDRRGRLWVSRPSLLEVYAASGEGPPTLISLGEGIEPGHVFLDREDDLWVTTETQGLFRVQRTPFVTVGAPEGLSAPSALLVAVDVDGSILAVDASMTLNRIVDGRTTPVALPVERGHHHNVGVDGRGTLWVHATGSVVPGDFLLGLTRGGDTLRASFDGPIADFASDVRDPGTLWVAAGGVHRLDAYAPGGPRVVATPIDEPWTPVRLFPRPGGGVWVVTRSELARVDAQGVERVSLPDSLLGSDLRAAWEDEDGALWIGTYGGGLLHAASGRVGRIMAKDGLAEDVVSSIIPDDRGMLWMGGNRSVHRISLAQARAFLAGERDRVDGVAYGVRDGLRAPETSGFDAARGPDGRLWFPTFGGVAGVDPREAAELEGRPPTVMVETVTVSGTVLLPSAGAVSLPAGRRDLDVLLASTSLRNAGGVVFEYRLEGVDAGWSRAGSDRSVRYSGVRGGSHRFRVRALSSAGVWSPEEATLLIQVPRRFTETAAFPLLLLAMAAGGAWLLVLARTRASEARAEALERVVARRTEELQETELWTEETLETVIRQSNELKEVGEARNRFFSNVTHELRTPLTLMLGPLDDLQAGRVGVLPEGASRELQMVRANGGRLLELVDQLLDIARVEAGQMPLRPSPGDPADFLQRVTSPFQAHARARSVAFESDLADLAGEATFDPDCLEKVVVNLLGNAFKFTPAGGRVRLSARTVVRGGTLELHLEVADTGRGIPAYELERIFERFQRVDEREGTATGGTGVGLSLVRELTHLMGGGISVESREGHGSTFTVEVPVGRAAAAGQPAPAGNGVGPAEAPGGSGDGAGLPDGAETLPTLLLAEDHPDLRAYLRRHLEPRFRVLEAADGAEALEAARKHVPDVVVSDIMMPVMDGEELCRRVKSDRELDYIPVVLLTAKASRESRLAGLRHGADAYLTKPFDMEELTLTVTNMVQARRRLRERLAAEGQTLPEIPPPWQGATDHGTERFLEHLYRCLTERIADEDLTPEQLAQVMHMSRSTLYRRMQDALGTSAMEVIWNFRLDQAAKWLAETDGSVSEVAYAVGFKSVSHFSRKFRERFARTPSQAQGS